MDPRTRIPVLALLGLSCTDCTERGGSVPDPIVGEWRAVDIDGEAFPLMVSDEDYALRVGWALEIRESHRGKLAYYYEEEGEYDLIARSESYSDLMVAVDDAPKYRITLAGDLSDIVGYDGYEGGPTQPDDSYGGSSGYATEGDTTDLTTGALDLDEQAFDEFELELGDAVHPTRAGTMILDCELAAEVLTCERKPDGDGDDELRTWRFERAPE